MGKPLGQQLALKAGALARAVGSTSPNLCPEQDGQDVPGQLAGPAAKGRSQPAAGPRPTEKVGNNVW